MNIIIIIVQPPTLPIVPTKKEMRRGFFAPKVAVVDAGPTMASASVSASPSTFDLVIVIDTTGSMGVFLTALRTALPQVLRLLRLLPGTVERIGAMSYKDYDAVPIVRVSFSGWDLVSSGAPNVVRFINGLRPTGGGSDSGEASKSAASRLIDEVSWLERRQTLVVWYTDSPPHFEVNNHVNQDDAYATGDPNSPTLPKHISAVMELDALGEERWDWLWLGNALRERNITVIPIIPGVPAAQQPKVDVFSAVMAAQTGGAVLGLQHSDQSATIAKHTIGLLMCAAGWDYGFGPDVARVTMPHLDLARVPTERAFMALLKSRKKARLVELERMGAENVRRFVRGGGGNSHLAAFRTDAAFQETVYAVFRELAADPALALTLTYNVIFGTFWRAICARRLDPRRDAIVDAMSSTVSGMGAADQASMKVFIELSYDRSEEIAELCAAARLRAPGGPELVLDVPAGEARLTRAELVDVTRTCVPAALAKVARLLSGLRVVTAPGSLSIPLSLFPGDLFAALPHLMSPGVLFSLRPSVVLAGLAVTLGTAAPIKDAATEHLRAVRGTWFEPVTVPEQASVAFVRFALRTFGEAFTPEEHERLVRMSRVAGLRANALTTLHVSCGYASNKTVRPDRKRACTECGHLRSMTLMLPDGTCGLCNVPDDPDYGRNTPDLLGPDKSCMCDCSNCGVVYAVALPANLNVRPKCHLCRKAPVSPCAMSHDDRHALARVRPIYTVCALCKNHFVITCQEDRPEPSLGAPCGATVEVYVCPSCDVATAVTDSVEVSVRDFLAANGGLALVGMGHAGGVAGFFDDYPSLFKAFPSVTFSAEAHPSDLNLDLRVGFGAKSVLNGAEVLAELEGWVGGKGNNGFAELGMCDICFEDMPKHVLRPMCGRRACRSVACAECLTNWYAEPKPGSIVAPAHMSCAYCKKRPSPRVLAKHAPLTASLTKADVEACADTAFHVGWCLDCGHIKRAVARECLAFGADGGAITPVMTDFRCVECVDARDRAQQGSRGTPPMNAFRESPCCSVMTHKVSGCNHIECACGVHWCWECGHSGATSGEIYDHMSKEHGGFYGVEDGDDDDDDDDDDDPYDSGYGTD